MLAPSLIEIFVGPLNKKKIDYIITGSVASVIYGEPRLTHDVDLVLDLKNESVVAPPEYVIIRKLEYYREGQSEKHLRDIASMLKISSKQIDISFVDSQTKAQGLSSEWRQAQKALGT